MIDKDSIEALKQRLDIVDVIGNYLELKKSGTHYKALCPFHSESTPSFVVSPSKQIFHCFGCQASGDAIKFVMDYEKLSFFEAIEKLASLYNITLCYSKQESSKDLHKILTAINEYYKTMLDHNKEALEYLARRGVFESSIEKFELGYAPDSRLTLEFLKSRFFPFEEALEAGVVGEDGGRFFARFIERITFPIHSPSGKIVGFGARTLGNHPAKYVNSPQSKIFNKSRLLYGYHLAKEEIHKTRKIIVTEGYLDVVMLHQAGFGNAVATLGTALTKEHLPLLGRGEPKVILAYDGDAAGISAAFKASQLLSQHGFDGGVVLFPEGADPADMVKEKKSMELSSLFAHPKPFVDFILQTIVLRHNIKDPSGKEAALIEGTEYLKSLSPLFQEEYKPLLAALLKISPSLIKLSKRQQNTKINLDTKDIKELSIIKTLTLKPSLIDTVLDFINIDQFKNHPTEFSLILEGKLDHPLLAALLVDEDVKTFSEEELRKELLTFLISYYSNELKKITKQNMVTFEEKIFLVRKYKHIIEKLKKGELVSHEGIGTF